MLGIAAIVLAGAIIWYFFLRPLSHWTKQGVKQSKPWIFFGDTGSTILKWSSWSDFVSKMYNMHPGERYSGCYSFTKPILVLRDPELIKQITIKDFEHFTDHPPIVDPDADPLWNKALLSLTGDRWKEMRNTLSPTFTSSKIKYIYALMLDTTESFVNHFLEKEGELIEVELKDSFSRFSNDIIATTAFGVQVNSLKDKENTFYKMGQKITSLSPGTFFMHQKFSKLLNAIGMPFLDKDASKYFYAVMDDTIQAREDNKIVRSDMIHLMLEARRDDPMLTSEIGGTEKIKGTISLTNKEMTSQAMIFFFGGFDTASTTMCFGAYELALNKDVQDRLREEIIKTKKQGKISYDELMQMKYMDMVVSEILRKWPPFAFFNRACTKPYTIQPVRKGETPIRIPVNQELWVPIYGFHRDPKYFPDPEKFNPERFSDENKSNIVPYTYIPFGSGPRNCIGSRFALVEVKAILFNLLLHYEIVPTKRTQIPLVVLSKGLSQIPEDGFHVGLKRVQA